MTNGPSIDPAEAQLAIMMEQHREMAERARGFMARSHTAMLPEYGREAVEHSWIHTAMLLEQHQRAVAERMNSDFENQMRYHRAMVDRVMPFTPRPPRQGEIRFYPALPEGGLGFPRAGHYSREDPATSGERVRVAQRVSALPQEKLTASAVARLKRDSPDCPICLVAFGVKEVITRLPCLHTYHSGCVKDWLQQSNTCPVCKQRVS